jgi:3-deoxy-D-manno-octulosonic-acid transferase
VVNARMSPRSLRRYRWLRRWVRPLFGRVDLFAAQTDEYAAGFSALGARPDRIHVTDNVKYDGVAGDRNNPRTRELGRLLAIEPEDLVWVAGSTQAPEEEMVLGMFQRLRSEHPRLRLILVPRQRERFDVVAELLRQSGEPFVRRSAISTVTGRPVILVDTIGELGALWGLADVAFVGGSLDGRRGGQNMIEPAAYGAAVVFGPHVWNFRHDVARLLAAKAAIQVNDAAALEATVRRLLGDASERERLGTAAREFVRRQQGATERTMDLLDRLLARKLDAKRVA